MVNSLIGVIVELLPPDFMAKPACTSTDIQKQSGFHQICQIDQPCMQRACAEPLINRA